MNDLDLVFAGIVSIVYMIMIYLLITKRHVLMMKALEIEHKGLSMREDPNYKAFKEKWFGWLK